MHFSSNILLDNVWKRKRNWFLNVTIDEERLQTEKRAKLGTFAKRGVPTTLFADQKCQNNELGL